MIPVSSVENKLIIVLEIMKVVNMKNPTGQFCGRTRREMLWQMGGGFVGLGLTAMLNKDGFLSMQSQGACLEILSQS